MDLPNCFVMYDSLDVVDSWVSAHGEEVEACVHQIVTHGLGLLSSRGP